MLKNSIQLLEHVRLCTFQEVLPLWQKELWPQRQSQILSKSSLCFGGGHDLSIYERAAEPVFWGHFADERLVAVNSGFWTSDHEFRSRGLYVHPQFRHKGVAQVLLKHLLTYAIENKARKVWSIPRKTALKTYQSVGFKTYGDFFSHGMEFGPNIFVYKDL